MNKIWKYIFIIILLAISLGIGYYFLFSKVDKAGNTAADNAFGWQFPTAKFPLTGPGQLAYSDIRDPGGIPEGLPVRLKIPTIKVDSAIEDALITPDGRMDVPSGSVNVAWFALGPHPGDVGSAVIGGHFGIRNGVKFVFYDLDKLKIGDKVYIENDKGDTLAFQVRSIKLFDRNADATTVFTSNDGFSHLNLITCEGIWNQVNGNYPERRVVFTDAIPGEGPVTVKSPVVSFHKTLRTGARGADVVELQNALKQKGLLTFSGVADGSFGPLTRAAVTKYQKSVGLTPDGVLGPLSRAKLFSELPVAKTGLPTTGITIPESTSSHPKNFSEFLKGLYMTPVDGLVTTLLMLAILFVVYKIIRRTFP